VKRWPWLLLALAGCSDIGGTKGGVVALELRLPTPPAVEQHDTLPLVARALDADGNEVQGAQIFWIALDSSLILDSTGTVTTDSSSGSGRIQARTGTLLSDLVTLEIHRRSDTLAVTGPTTLTVLSTDSASGGLLAAVQSLTPDTAGVNNTRILYQVVDTAAAKGKVRFEGNTLALRAATGADGQPATAVTLRRVPGATAPASVIVRVSATRPSGIAVPGSGQTFTINFQ
jgi:hypothetical protein